MVSSRVFCVAILLAPFPLLQLRGPRDLYGSGASTVQYSVCVRACVCVQTPPPPLQTPLHSVTQRLGMLCKTSWTLCNPCIGYIILKKIFKKTSKAEIKVIISNFIRSNCTGLVDMVSILPCTLNRTLLVPSSQNTVQMLSFGRSEGQSNVCTQRYDLRFFWWIFSTFKRLLRRPRTAGPTIAHE